MSDFYGSSGQMEAFIAKLEKQREAHPENRVALEQLIDVYAARKEIAQATRALDASRAAAAQDADLLYFIASLYGRVGLKEMTEQTLEQVLKVDAKHAAASNDLGYSWADAGKNLGRAETLVKTAVEAEPDNQSYLDSLGWVLYKRGKFAEARSALEEAIGTSSLPDPVVLDHLGDTLYRLNLGEEAAKQWKHSRERLAPASQANEERDELRQLRLQLQQKLKQAESGETVNVAPVADSPEARSPHAQK
jgi:tetratricopeptide (TPR) repeat protein